MPEGDTIFRTATTLRRWLGGREITGARTTVAGVAAAALVGDRVSEVEARGKHLLVRFDSRRVLHTHMRMTGSWHVYSAGERWHRPASQARLVLEAGDRLAVCFNAPVVELLAPRMEQVHPSLTGLGPDVLVQPLDLAAVRTRAAGLPRETEIGDVLLDQRVVAGIGNIYRCETLFLGRVHPKRPLGSVEDATLDRLVLDASRLMRANARPESSVGREFGLGADGRWVYGRARRPCRRCGTRIVSARTGSQARTAYWCPRCQPAPPGSGGPPAGA